MCQRPGRPRFFRFVRGIGDKPVQSRNGVLEHRRKIIGKGVSGTGCNRRFEPSTMRTPARPCVASVPCRSRSIRSTSLSSDKDTVRSRWSLTTWRSRSGVVNRRRSSFMSRHRTSIHRQKATGSASTRGRNPRLNNATSATRPAPASSKFVARSAWIYRRHRQVFRDVTKRMRVAYREIVQPALDAGIPANRKIRLVPLNVKRAAVNATDTEPFIAWFARRQRHRQIVLACLRPARPRVQITACGRTHTRNHHGRRRAPTREAALEKRDQGPHRLWRQRVVVARESKNRADADQGAPERLCKPLPKVRSRFRIVEYISDAQDQHLHALRRATSRILGSRPCAPVTTFSDPLPGTTGSAARGASRQCAATNEGLPIRAAAQDNQLAPCEA